MSNHIRDLDWSDVLTLLSMMVLADGKVYQEEMEAFKKAAIELRDLICPKVMLTEQMAFDWFTLHRDNILERMGTHNYPTAVAETLENLDVLPDKQMFVMALLKIALSDGVEHGAESRLITMASKHWDVELAVAS